MTLHKYTGTPELPALRDCVARARPFEDNEWTKQRDVWACKCAGWCDPGTSGLMREQSLLTPCPSTVKRQEAYRTPGILRLQCPAPSHGACPFFRATPKSRPIEQQRTRGTCALACSNCRLAAASPYSAAARSGRPTSTSRARPDKQTCPTHTLTLAVAQARLSQTAGSCGSCRRYPGTRPAESEPPPHTRRLFLLHEGPGPPAGCPQGWLCAVAATHGAVKTIASSPADSHSCVHMGCHFIWLPCRWPPSPSASAKWS